MTTQTSAALPEGVVFVPHEDLAADPHGWFARVRPNAPSLSPDGDRFYVLRSHDVTALLSDPRVVQIPGERYAQISKVPPGVLHEFLKTFMLMSNAPEHGQRRGPVARTFSHPAMRAERAKIRAVADRIIGDMPRGEPFDFVDRIASRIPAEMIAEILGLPQSDADWFRTRVYSMSRCFSAPYAVDKHDEIEAATVDLLNYVGAALDDRRATPRDDLLSALASDAQELGSRDMTFQVMGLILGGSDTTRAGIAMLVTLLLQNPDAWAEVKANPDLIPAAVAEALRIEPPIASLPRIGMQPIEVGGVTLPPGKLMLMSTMSAMRDPGLYPDPDRFDLHRTGGPRAHMVFGGGVHRCLGEMLARIEMEETLAALIATAPDIELVEPAKLAGYGGIRRISAMTVKVPD